MPLLVRSKMMMLCAAAIEHKAIERRSGAYLCSSKQCSIANMVRDLIALTSSQLLLPSAWLIQSIVSSSWHCSGVECCIKLFHL